MTTEDPSALPCERIAGHGVYSPRGWGARNGRSRARSAWARRPRVVQGLRRGDLERLLYKRSRGRKCGFGLTARGHRCGSCYEAGREGFWLHRALTAHGVVNVVVDPSSIAVDRRARRVKTDRVDATAAGDPAAAMQRPAIGEAGARSACPPSKPKRIVTCSANGRPSAMIGNGFAIASRACWATHGLTLPLTPGILRCGSEQVRRWDAQSAGRRIDRASGARVDAAAGRSRRASSSCAACGGCACTEQDDGSWRGRRGTLAALRGMAENGALTLTTELFAWRGFTNGRQIGAIVGLTPTPYRSDQQGGSNKGLVKVAIAAVRTLSVELAWCWIRWQPGSALTRWFYQALRHARARPAHRHRGRGAQAADCLVAVSGARDAPGGCPAQSVSGDSVAAGDRAGAGARRSVRGRVASGPTGRTEGAARPCSRLASTRRMGG